MQMPVFREGIQCLSFFVDEALGLKIWRKINDVDWYQNLNRRNNQSFRGDIKKYLSICRGMLPDQVVQIWFLAAWEQKFRASEVVCFVHTPKLKLFCDIDGTEKTVTVDQLCDRFYLDESKELYKSLNAFGKKEFKKALGKLGRSKDVLD